MDWYERYKHRIQLNGTTSQERIINQKKKEFDNYIRNAPNRFEINIDEDINNNYLITLQDVTLNNKNGDEKYVVTYNETPMKIGSIFKCLSNTFLITEKEYNVMQDHQTFKTRPCNHILKWLDSNGDLQKCPSIVENQTFYTTGSKSTKYEYKGDATESIILPLNEYTNQIKPDKRFIINDNIWKVTNVNKDTKGLIYLMCLETEYNPSTDNLEEEIADYYNNIHKYKLEIQNKQPILLNLNETLKLDIVAYDNDIIVNSPNLSYTISDTEILEIENDTIKPLKVGTCKVNIQFKDIIKEIEISIVNDESKNYSIIINGNDYIKWGRDADYNVIFKVDGSEYNNTCDFYLTDRNNNSTILATIISKDNNKCTIQANDKQKCGFIVLHCVDKIGLHETKEIEIRSIWV